MLFTNTNTLDIPALSCSEIGLVHSIGKAGIPVYAGSYFKDNPALHSKFTHKKVLFDRYDKKEYINQLCEFGEQLDYRPVLYSDDDRALLHISRYREKLSKYYRFLLPDHEIVKKILDKRLFVHLCKEYDLPAPKSFEVGSKEELDRAASELPFPVIIKPAYKQDWWHDDFEDTVGPYKKAYKSESPEELKQQYEKISKINKRAVVQEFIPGSDDQLYSVNMFVNENSEWEGYFLAQKRRIYPITAGTGCYVVTVEDEDIINTAREVTQRLGLQGLVNIQFKKDSRTAEPRLMEIHTRNSFWGYLGTGAGINLPALYYYSLTGKVLPENRNYEKGFKYIDIGKDIKAFLEYNKNDKLNWKEWIQTYNGNFVVGGMLIEDPIPILMNFWYILLRRLPVNKL